jgi:hypothetical protein
VIRLRSLLGCSLLASVLSCVTSKPAPAPQPTYGPPVAQPYPGYYPPPQPQYGPPGTSPYPQPTPYPQQQYPQPPYAQTPQGQPPQGPYAPAPPAAPAPQPVRPLLAPLVGPAAWQAEVRSVLAEQIANLSPQNQAKVRGIPLVFDPNPYEINAFAGCNDQGSPFLAGTEGLLEAVDAIAQTRATDDLYGTKTYEQYAAAITPRLVQSDKASAALPLGIIPLNVLANPQRLSHAHEWFDDIVAFTFGHELAHHYLGHTGCATGQVVTPLTNLGQLISGAPFVSQPMEAAADNAGVIDSLDTGRARRPAYRWSEAGGVALLDFFARLEQAGGVSALNLANLFRSHPYPTLRIPLIQLTARTWYLQHPG